MNQLTQILLVGGVLACAAALLLIAWLVHREAVAAGLREAAAAERQAETLRIELLDRRRAVCARIDALWLCWARCERPGEALLAEAAAAAEEARTLFPAELGPDLDEVSGLLLSALRTGARRRASMDSARHDERVALLEQEAALEQALKPKLSGLRQLLIEASRPGGPRGASGDD